MATKVETQGMTKNKKAGSSSDRTQSYSGCMHLSPSLMANKDDDYEDSLRN